jgi:hypothetical protein
MDQRMAVGYTSAVQLQFSDHLGRLFQVDVGHRHHLAVEQGLAATPNMILADGPRPNNTQLQRHTFTPLVISTAGPWPAVH